MPAGKQILTQKDTEAYVRLTAPQHMKIDHFRKHEKIEGYFENREVPDFVGSDRLLKLDTQYGTIQMGYNPRKGQSFLFANIKTSIFDTVASRHQKEIKEHQMARAQKTGTQNLAYSAKRRGGSAVILYKMENQPWTQRSIAPYLRRVNLEALRKTMPFLDRSGDLADRAKTHREQKDLHQKLSAAMAGKNYGEMAAIRAQQTDLIARQNHLNALLYRGETQQRLFFRKLNYALDMQKHEMFAYYRNRRTGGKTAERDTAPVEPPRDEDKDE
jgi:hypothetical protein